MDMSQIIGVKNQSLNLSVTKWSDSSGTTLWQPGETPAVTYATATAVGDGTDTIIFDAYNAYLSHTFFAGAIQTITNNTPDTKVVTSLYRADFDDTKANYISYTQGGWSGNGYFGGTASVTPTWYANRLKLTVSGCIFADGITYKLEYAYGEEDPTWTLESTTVGSGVYQVSYTGLTKEPDIFIQMVYPTTDQQIGNTTRTQYIVFHKGDAHGYGMYTGNTNRANYDDASKFTYTYNNGTLTIKASQIYVHQGQGVTQELMAWNR